jgi:hypothetical protein
VHFAEPATAIYTTTTASILAERKAFGVTATRAADVARQVAESHKCVIGICHRYTVEV